MHEGERPGQFLRADADGWLVNDTSIDRAPPEWGEVIAAVVKLYQDQLGDALHSVWIRGSAVSGRWVLGVSDLDTHCVARLPPSRPGGLWVDTPWADAASAALTAPGLAGVEIVVASLEAMYSERGAYGRFILATQACRLVGEPLELPRFRVGREICFVSGHVRGALTAVEREWPTSTAEVRSNIVRWLAKTLIRAGLELVMDEDGRYARDLWPCYLAFAEHRSDRAAWMLRAVDLAVAPTPNQADIDFMMEDLGPWLLQALVDRGLADAE